MVTDDAAFHSSGKYKYMKLFFSPVENVLEQKLNINSSYFTPLLKCEKRGKTCKACSVCRWKVGK